MLPIFCALPCPVLYTHLPAPVVPEMRCTLPTTSYTITSLSTVREGVAYTLLVPVLYVQRVVPLGHNPTTCLAVPVETTIVPSSLIAGDP